jgi:hypothetical protein
MEKYCVKHHQEVAEYIMKLKGVTFGYSKNLSLYSHFPPIDGSYCSYKIESGYKLITIEEFRELFLNQTTTHNYEIY